jgi:N6-L-threonylcarbamoyladenine synthase
MLVLGIESSCDETAAALVDNEGHIHANIIASQMAEHTPFGGVVPEFAARAHLARMDGLVREALNTAKAMLSDITAVASTCGPGLIGGLMTGVMFGRALAEARKLPWLGINHLEGHALTARLTHQVKFPYLLLLVSGGHTQLLEVLGVGEYRRLGTTLDDAAGECFDKAAKLMELGFPGGPALERAAIKGDASLITLPHPMAGRPGCDFSFSGLKNAVRIATSKTVPENYPHLAAATQHAITTVLTDRTQNALSICAAQPNALVVAGGVAANRAIRSALEKVAQQAGLPFIAPPLNLCGDNAAMIAWAAIERLQSGIGPADDGHPRPRWSLDANLSAA